MQDHIAIGDVKVILLARRMKPTQSATGIDTKLAIGCSSQRCA